MFFYFCIVEVPLNLSKVNANRRQYKNKTNAFFIFVLLRCCPLTHAGVHNPGTDLLSCS